MGASRDAAKPEYYTFKPSDAPALQAGLTYTITLTNQDRVVGKFIRLEREPNEEYMQAYSRFKRQSNLVLPSSGERVILTTNSGRELLGTFKGFDHPNIMVVHLQDRPRSSRVIIDSLKIASDVHGKHFDIISILDAIGSKEAPILSNLFIEEGVDEVRIALNDVREIHQRPQKRGKLTGFLVGAAIDVALTIAILAQFNTFEDTF